MHARARILDLSGDTTPWRVDSAKRWLWWTLRALPKAEPVVIKGCMEHSEISNKGPMLLEIYGGQKVASTSDEHTVGFVIYIAEFVDGLWEAKRYRASTHRTRIPLEHGKGPFLFRTENEAWTWCHLWCEYDRLNSTFAGFLEAIQEPPLHALPLKKEDSIDRIPMLTQEDVEKAEWARFQFERRQQPAVFELCRELGWETVLSPQDERLRAAQVLDAARKTGEVPADLPRTDSSFLRKLDNCVRCHDYRQLMFDRRAEDEACRDLVKHWITLGFIFLSKSGLASLINRKHHTRFTPVGIAATCRRLGLTAKRALVRPEELSGEALDAALSHELEANELSGSYFG